MADNTFELGLVMAGAISAGAYTAGVMDFLIEVLDAFEAAKKEPGWDGPTHDVRVPLMAGASAGGMTSAMAALQSFHEIEHVQPGAPAPPPEKNRLYANWVSRIDLKGLLETADLDGDRRAAGVQSALCCDILDEIVKETFVLSGAPQPRAWLGRADDRSLRVLMTLTNLRGVAYSFDVVGAEKLPYSMLNHGDYLDFKIGKQPTPTAGSTPLDIDQTDAPDWTQFRAAALATGAFPVGLAPRTIEKNVAAYKTSLRVGRDLDTGFVTIPPDAGMDVADPYAFVAVDGGTIDNEPLEIGRRLLAQGDALHDDGISARKAIILIAPFPSFTQPPPPFVDGLKLIDVLPQLSTTLIQQSRFKPDELARAANEKFFSRFLISPERDGDGSDAAKLYPIASGVLHGFGGFIDESFRRHDFLLGRRNAQAFLRYHLALPENHELFRGTKDKANWYVCEPKKDTDDRTIYKKFATTVDSPLDSYGLPIIPLCGGLDKEIVIRAVDLPKPGTVDRQALESLIRTRANKVLEVLLDQDLSRLTDSTIFGPAERLGAQLYLTSIVTKKASDILRKAVEGVMAAFA